MLHLCIHFYNGSAYSPRFYYELNIGNLYRHNSSHLRGSLYYSCIQWWNFNQFKWIVSSVVQNRLCSDVPV